MRVRAPLSVLATVPLALAALAGCGSAADEDDAGAASGAGAGGAFPVSIEHAFGETTIEEEPERVVVLGWGAQDTVYALGLEPVGMPTYADFRAGIASVLNHVRTQCTGNVLLVSSGGPISTAVGLVLGTTPQTTIDLNMRIRNSAVSEFVYTPSRHVLLTYNTLPHLDHPDHAGWITFA